MTLNITPRPVRLGHGKIEKKPWAIIGGCQYTFRSALVPKQDLKAAAEK